MRRDTGSGLHHVLVWLLYLGQTASYPSNHDLEPPIIISGPPQGELYFDPDSPFLNSTILNCTASGKPPPRYIWKKDGETLRGETHSSVSVGRKLGPGLYQCVAVNQYGTAISNITTVHQASVHKEPKSAKSARTGEVFSLKCGASVVPPGEFWWDFYRNGGNVVDEIPVTENSHHTVLQADGTLYFSQVSNKDNGTYRCYVSSRINPTVVHYAEVDLKVVENEGQSQLQEMQLMYSTPSPVIAKTGSTVNLQCIYGGSSHLIVTWQGGTRRSNGSSLTLRNVSAADSNVYRCTAITNGNVKEANITLQVKDPVKVKLTSKINHKDRIAEFNCDSSRMTRAQWYINGKPLNEAGEGFKVHGHLGAELKIQTRKTKNKTMTITCNVTDEYSYDISNTILIINDTRGAVPPYATIKPTNKSGGKTGLSSLLVIVIAVVIVIILCAVGVLVGYMIRELRRTRRATADEALAKALQKREDADEEVNKENERRQRGQEEFPLIKASSKENNSPNIIIVVQPPAAAPPQDDSEDNGGDSGIE